MTNVARDDKKKKDPWTDPSLGPFALPGLIANLFPTRGAPDKWVFGTTSTGQQVLVQKGGDAAYYRSVYDKYHPQPAPIPIDNRKPAFIRPMIRRGVNNEGRVVDYDERRVVEAQPNKSMLERLTEKVLTPLFKGALTATKESYDYGENILNEIFGIKKPNKDPKLTVEEISSILHNNRKRKPTDEHNECASHCRCCENMPCYKRKRTIKRCRRTRRKRTSKAPRFSRGTGRRQTKEVNSSKTTVIFPRVDPTAQGYLLGGVIAGTGFVNRIGRTIVNKKLTLNFAIKPSVPASLMEATHLRAIVVYDAQTNGTAPLWSDVIQSYNWQQVASSLTQDSLNPNNKDRFKILMDKQWFMDATTAAGLDMNGLAPTMKEVSFQRTLSLRNMITKYQADTGVLPAPSDISTGGLFLLLQQDTAITGTNTAGYSLDYTSRLVFSD